MALTANITFAAPDPAAAPLTLTQLVNILNALATVDIPGTFAPYIVSATKPAVDDQDKIWHKIDAVGRPLGTFKFYNGLWRQEYTGIINEVKMYTGDPVVDFDSTGLGLPGKRWDGWALSNGQNGTADLSNRFIIGGAMDNTGITGYTGGLWRTNVSGGSLSLGGASSITSNATNTYLPSTIATQVKLFTADGNAPSVSGDLYGPGTGIIITPATAGNPNPPSIPIIPPFFALAYVTFLGYEPY